MNSFEYNVPTKVIFGKETEGKVAQQVQAFGGTNVLVIYGGGSVVKSGLLGRIYASLDGAGIAYAARGGVKPNPALELAQSIGDEFKDKGINFILAVGGGSVIDTAKAISYFLANPATPIWDYYSRKATPSASLPLGVVLTISAAGSETSCSSVLTCEATGEKRGTNSELCRPRFAIMNPELTYTLPVYQIACGATDIFMHTFERYLGTGADEWNNVLTDQIAEGVMRTTVASGLAAIKNPNDYEAQSELMWCGSLSHCDLTGLGRTKDFSVHQLGHEISGKFDAAHAAGLSIMWATWARYVYTKSPARFAKYARAVWNVTEQDDVKAALAGIDATEAFLKALDMPVCFSDADFGVQSDEVLRELAHMCSFQGERKVGVFFPVDEEAMFEIYKKANY